MGSVDGAGVVEYPPPRNRPGVLHRILIFYPCDLVTAMLKAIVALLAASSSMASDVCGCGPAGAACCNCMFRPLDDKCLFNLGSQWCDKGLSCDGRVCQSPVADSSADACGKLDLMCCDGVCDPGLLCASGSCVDPEGVMDSTPCGLNGAPCCGAYEDCDEDLVCQDEVCMTT